MFLSLLSSRRAICISCFLLGLLILLVTKSSLLPQLCHQLQRYQLAHQAQSVAFQILRGVLQFIKRVRIHLTTYFQSQGFSHACCLYVADKLPVCGKDLYQLSETSKRACSYSPCPVQVDIEYRRMDCLNQGGDSSVLSALRPGMSSSVSTAARTPSNPQPLRLERAALVLL